MELQTWLYSVAECRKDSKSGIKSGYNISALVLDSRPWHWNGFVDCDTKLSSGLVVDAEFNEWEELGNDGILVYKRKISRIVSVNNFKNSGDIVLNKMAQYFDSPGG